MLSYLRFYLKVIEPNSHKILQDDLNRLPNWDGVMGLQFENLVLNNRRYIKKILGLTTDDIIMDDPYFQRNTNLHLGCQIDYLIQTKYRSLHLCEIKFSKDKIGMDVIEAIQEKIDRLKAKKNFLFGQCSFM